MTAPAGDRPRVLVVDDEPDFRSALATRLERRGFDVDLAADGAEALGAASASPPDVVVLDVLMPGLDGIATLRRFRSEHPEIPVILLTGHASASSGIDGMRLGAFDYLTKPVPVEELVEKLHAAVHARR